MFGRNTRSLVEDVVTANIVTTGDAPNLDIPNNRPLRITLKNLKLRITLCFELEDCVSLGREKRLHIDMRHIDLEPYNAHRLGVSRTHAILKLEEGQVFIIDNNSANGVWLNQERLHPLTPYLVHHGDIIRLAEMALQIGFPRIAFSDLAR